MPTSAAKEKSSTKKSKLPSGRYIEAVGRRKRAVARVRLFESGNDGFEINGRQFEKYFPTEEIRAQIMDALKVSGVTQKFKVTAKIHGGGVSAQGGALRLGIARALVLYDHGLRKKLKKAGFLKRDSRIVERKKFGLKKARKAAQWSKR